MGRATSDSRAAISQTAGGESKDQTRSIRTRLMIRPRVEGCDSIIPSRQPSSYIGGLKAIHRGVAQRSEKRKGPRIRRRGLTKPGQPVDNNMGMPENVPGCVYCDRSSHVSVPRIREPAGVEVVDYDLDGERLVCLQRSKVGRENELGRGHVVHARNGAHRSGVA